MTTAEANQPESVSVADRIRAVLGEASPAERRVARALLSKYPTAGLESTVALAERAGASPPTVVRFVARLGVGGYRDFQSLLRDEVQQRRVSQVTRLPEEVASDSHALQESSMAIFPHEITETLSTLPLSEFDAAVELLSARRSRVTSFGGSFTRLMAEYLDLHLRQMRSGTRAYVPSPDSDSPMIVDAGRNDVFVVFDVRRYQRDVVSFSHALHNRGSRLILVTDPWLSPVAEIADVVLPARVGGVSPFDSLAPVMVLVEMLAAGVYSKLGVRAANRIRDVDSVRGDVVTD